MKVGLLRRGLRLHGMNIWRYFYPLLIFSTILYLAFGGAFSYRFIVPKEGFSPVNRSNDQWREFVANDTYVYSVHVIDSLRKVRFIVADLVECLERLGLCCYHDADNTVSSIALFKHYRVPELESDNRQVFLFCKI